ncbi:Serine/threonine-protein phosphatase 6 regulatory ankyrin repeat subunit B (PP6-ARS-B) (Serine/threonine-protein phosphatase 6 regulatory subunit ARS-B) (Ankyrin repeat domain-containing protein 44) [Durusdinium trenchii]|uniref:Serine/threonine-protein phosphatase 6 regulatory ankyrin repeat subunit B (PP6-ARS-B) (Serine/threonine-protein phosphatase 6 regulatory subunit ARS-B) (Ankyrin repeat domain-containing protein 44) n=1 Tax=Durusdinium trenchii TaxID=1381693 RepID=A0ABP0SN04_9DINO
MLCCRSPAPLTPLASYAESLALTEDEANPMLLPMYTVPLAALLQMGEIEPHEELKAKGTLVVFDQSLGNAAFVSHQWVGLDHPDPEFKQMRVFQAALRHAMSQLQHIPLDVSSEAVLPSSQTFATSELTSRHLFIWYDYFSCPQLERPSNLSERSELSKAIDSIPAYVASSAFFFVLCPVIESEAASKVFSPSSWSQRGWCRLERACYELGQQKPWIRVKGSAVLELNGGAGTDPMMGPAAEGDFSVEEDRAKIAQVLVPLLRHRLRQLLRVRDLVSYRVVLNQQSVYLRGTGVEDFYTPLPSFSADPLDLGSLVEEFLHQNGLTGISERDRGGWLPIHYAALSGSCPLIQGLLARRANPNQRTRQDQPLLGVPPLSSALSICLFFQHFDATRLLIFAKASLAGVGHTIWSPMLAAGVANNPEGIRALCAAGCSPHEGNILVSAFYAACAHGSTDAVQELLRKTGGQGLNMTFALHTAMFLHGGRAELVQHLVELRADVNDQTFTWWKLSSAMGLLARVKSVQHKLGRQTTLTKILHHGGHRATPLMLAMLTAQYEGAAALVAAGARVDVRNSHGLTAADLAEGQLVPEFLLEAFAGRPAACQTVTLRALSSAHVELQC